VQGSVGLACTGGMSEKIAMITESGISALRLGFMHLTINEGECHS